MSSNRLTDVTPASAVSKPGITKEDVVLAKAAKERAGGPAILAKMFGVTSPAASQWGRTRPIPRHVRPQLETFVRSAVVPETSSVDTGRGTETGTGSSAWHELIRLIHPDLAGRRVAHLAPRARRRYQERVMEIL